MAENFLAREWGMDRMLPDHERRLVELEKRPNVGVLLAQYNATVAFVRDTSFSYNSASAVWVVMSDLTLSGVPVLSGYTYEVHLTVAHFSTIVSDVVGLKVEVNTGAWADIGSFSRASNSSTTIAGTGNMPGTIAFSYVAAATGTVDFRASIQRAVGTGTVTASASAGNVASLKVTRIGVF